MEAQFESSKFVEAVIVSESQIESQGLSYRQVDCEVSYSQQESGRVTGTQLA